MTYAQRTGTDVAKWLGLGLAIATTLTGFGVSMGIILARVNDGQEVDRTQNSEIKVAAAKIEAQAVLQAQVSSAVTRIDNSLFDIKEELKDRRKAVANGNP